MSKGRTSKKSICLASTNFPATIQYGKTLQFVKRCKRHVKPLPLTCTSNHLHSLTPLHFWQHSPLPSKPFCLYCQATIYCSCNFPNLLSVCEQKELICSKHIRNKEGNCFAKFSLSTPPPFFLINFPKLQMSQGKQMPP